MRMPALMYRILPWALLAIAMHASALELAARDALTGAPVLAS